MQLFPQRLRLLFLVAALLVLGFVTTSLASYWVSRAEIHQDIVESALPLTGDNIYSEIQKDMLRPVFISAQMAHDTFVRDWILNGEKDPSQIVRYLNEVKTKNGTFTSFLVSERSRHYYHAGGILKDVKENEARDAWYFRVREMSAPFETNVDPDLANRDKMTIFINYRVEDFQQRFIGAIGVGLTLDTMKDTLQSYERRFGRHIYFVNHHGEVVLTGNQRQHRGSILQQAGLREIAPQILNQNTIPTQLSYTIDRQLIQANTRYIPELGWYLIVEQNETANIQPLQRILLINLLISAVITILVIAVALFNINRNQRQLEQLATIDRLTQIPNRQAFEIVLRQKLTELSRHPRPMSGVLIDVDFFKSINDEFGHLHGDAVLQQIAALLRQSARASDVLARWGGEEFICLLDNCDLNAAVELAERMRVLIAEYDFALPRPHPVTISLGVAQLLPNENAIEFFQRADHLLYEAKAKSRNCVVVASCEV